MDRWNNVKGIGLILTFKCPAACKCCGYQAGPDRTEIMAVEDAKNIIYQAKKIKGIEDVTFTGGEPFLYLSQLAELISYANDLKLNTTIVTNGFWAKDFEKSIKIINCLMKRGLKNLAVSIDDFHMEYIPLKNAKNAVMAAISSGLSLDIQILKSKNNYIDKSNIIKILEVDGLNNNNISESSVIPVGRAAKYFNEHNLKYSRNENEFNMACPYVIEHPVISPNGDVAACCGLGSVAGTWYDESFIFGNIKRERLEDILGKMENDLLLNFISIEGPYKLIKLLNEECPEIELKDKYINICDVCLELISHEKIKDYVPKILIPRRKEMYIKKMYYHYHDN